jgi:hypothetical protein
MLSRAVLGFFVKLFSSFARRSPSGSLKTNDRINA